MRSISTSLVVMIEYVVAAVVEAMVAPGEKIRVEVAAKVNMLVSDMMNFCCKLPVRKNQDHCKALLKKSREVQKVWP